MTIYQIRKILDTVKPINIGLGLNRTVLNVRCFYFCKMRFLQDFIHNGYIIRLYKEEDGSFIIDYGKNLSATERRIFKDEKEMKLVLESRLGRILLTHE